MFVLGFFLTAFLLKSLRCFLVAYLGNFKNKFRFWHLG